uniref:Secreted protein n=1 Tax=Glossina palpalis gambiensis TaxID=67801 RepID=A0A1B0AKD7_9MUSC
MPSRLILTLCAITWPLFNAAQKKRKVPRRCFISCWGFCCYPNLPSKSKSNKIKKSRPSLTNKNGASKQNNTVYTHYCDQQSESRCGIHQTIFFFQT